jgi:hypothetical protein
VCAKDDLGDCLSAEFDRAMTKLLTAYARDGMLQFGVQTCIEWGHRARLQPISNRRST